MRTLKLKHLFILLPFILQSCKNEQVIEVNDWQSVFNKVKIEGTFVLSKLGSDSIFVHNPARLNNAYLPASTFKILNSLISLETKAIGDENEIIKWDGTKRFYDKWNQDQNLKSAIKYSCVWFYQELARRVGKDKMQHYLQASEYGNAKIGSEIDIFWLEGDLRISAKQQINFLNNFLNRKLPFQNENFDVVKSILMIDSTQSYKLYAKTGWALRTDKEIGWYVGFVERGEDIWVFAMNIDINESSDSKYREDLTGIILKGRGLID